MNDFTFPTFDQYCGSDTSNQLEIMQKRGTKAAATDFSILLGASVYGDCYVDGSRRTLADRIGDYWTSSDLKDNDVLGADISRPFSSWTRGVTFYGLRIFHHVMSRKVGGRPALPFSSIGDIPTNGVSRRANDGILEVEYGFYPQQAPDRNLQEKLEHTFQKGIMQTTGNKYTVDSRPPLFTSDGEKFSPRSLEEYEFEGKRYVRVLANFIPPKYELSNEMNIKRGDYAWIEVQPIRWLVDEKNKIMLSEKILFAGVQFKHDRNYKGDFRTTDIKQYMDNFFSKEILQTIHHTKNRNVNSEITKQPVNMTFDSFNDEETLKSIASSLLSIDQEIQSILSKIENPKMVNIIIKALTERLIQSFGLKTISINHVIHGDYSNYIEKMKDEEKRLTVVQLSLTDEANLERIRSFVANMGPEFSKLFDCLYSHNQSNHLQKMDGLKTKSKEKRK